MKEEVIAIAKLLTKMASRNQREVISQFTHAINSKKLDNARIIADELMDFFIEEDSDSKQSKHASDLYDKTMKFYELNS